MKISVAMATYNGMEYLYEQLSSIMRQLKPTDELIISDDGSDDGSREILDKLDRADRRVKVIDGPREGAVRNFENAVSHCTGDVIFLSDQDDMWTDNKVAVVMRHFERGADLVLHNAYIADKDLEPGDVTFFEQRGSAKGFGRNLLKNSYMGCCMAFTKEIKELALPFPDRLPMHDQWIGLVAERYGTVHFLYRPLLYYRRHENNVSSMSHAGTLQMIKWRISIYCAAKKRFRQIEKNKKKNQRV